MTITELPLPTRRRPGATPTPTSPVVARPELLPLDAGEQYRFGFSMEACVGCHSCEAACAEQNGLPDGTAWRRVGEIEGGSFPDTKRFHLSMACNHCIEPACLEGCPTEAYIKLDNGIVQHNAYDCIGCQYCTWNCPYSVPAFQPDRRIVTKCDMCLPRLEEGLTPACVDACPTFAITVEKVNIEEWRADHSAGNAPNLPDASLTLSTTRITLPKDMPAEMHSGDAWSPRPEHPHWPLVWLTLLTQMAVGASATADSGPSRLVAAIAAAAALAASLLHLGRPAHAWKALRNLRRSWLSREVALFGAYGGLAAATVLLPALTPLTVAVGVAGIYASGRLYIVPGRPAWNSPLTIVRFAATAVAVGPLLTGHARWAVLGVGLQVVATVANLVRLRIAGSHEGRGTLRLSFDWFRIPVIALVAGTLGAGLAAGMGLVIVALPLVALSELLGRYLFYVTVVPLDMPGSFSSRMTHL